MSKNKDKKTKIIRCSGHKNDDSRCTREKEFSIDEAPEQWFCYQHRDNENDLQDLTNNSYNNLSVTQLKAIDLLVTGKFTKTEIAGQCKITRQTIYNWLNDEDFLKAYKERLTEIKDNFDPQLLQMISKTMKSCDPAKLEGELSKIEAIERLFKLHNLLNNLPTDITKSEHLGMMRHELINKYSYMSKEELEKEGSKLKDLMK